MSFGLHNGRPLDPALGTVLIDPAAIQPLPDDIVTSPDAGRLDPRTWFAEPHKPFEIEIGSGKGTFLVQHAGHHPDTNFLGIEWAREFCIYAADRIRRHRQADGSLANVRMLHTDAVAFIRWRVPAGIVRVIHLYFSDPWPKTRHHKNRVVQHRFMAEAFRILEPGGQLRVVTDHDDLWAWDQDHFDIWTAARAHQHLEAFNIRHELKPEQPPFALQPFEPPEGAGEGELVGTNFERKFREEGRSFHACTLVRQR